MQNCSHLQCLEKLFLNNFHLLLHCNHKLKLMLLGFHQIYQHKRMHTVTD